MEYIKLFVSSVITIVGVILSWWLKRKYGEYKTNTTTRELKQQQLVQTILEQKLEEFGAQRAFIIQRHNGGKFGTGKSMNKMSTTYEALEEGVSTEFKNHQNLPMTLYTNFVTSVVEYNSLYPVVDDVDDILTKAFFVQRGTRSAIVFPIKKNNEFLGMVGFEWTHKARNLETMYKESMDDGRVLGETLSKLL